ncbi:MAG: glycosyltransferase [Verrucomicrobiota bacterium]|nr:glycosyltransferase [Verrucomicrobiota bacterium]
MKISIVVPAFNEERLLGASLSQIQVAAVAFTRRGWATELIVCDNNSTDRTAELARAAGATVVFEPFNQIARARNSGAAAATGEWLVFVDADSHPDTALFEEVAVQIESGRCLAGGCTVKLAGDYPLLKSLTALWNGLSRALHWMAGSFIFCEAKTFRALGGFSGELFAGEEVDLSRRLKKLARADGKQIVILHRHPLLTSARKAHLYSTGEYLRFLLKIILTGGKAVASRSACHPWYDGRR